MRRRTIGIATTVVIGPFQALRDLKHDQAVRVKAPK